jgi:putative transposase
VRQARIDQGQPSPSDQAALTSDERQELARLRKENRELRREKDFFQAGGGSLCERAAVAERFRLIEQLSGGFSVQWLCGQLGVARSGYYAWRRRQKAPGRRQAENAVLNAEIQAVYEAHRGFYGSPRLHQELRAADWCISRHRVARLMRRAGLQARTRRPVRPCKSASRGAHGVADNLLRQEFRPPLPNRCWAGDITYIRTAAGWR